MHASVNINAQGWNNKGVMGILHRLSNKGLASRITLEILETVHLNYDEDKEVVKHLRGLGFILAVDDYGTGQSQAYRVAQIKPDSLKIDGNIVRMLREKETKIDGIKLVQEAVSTARAFNATTTAEFVETEDVLNLLI